MEMRGAATPAAGVATILISRKVEGSGDSPSSQHSATVASVCGGDEEKGQRNYVGLL